MKHLMKKFWLPIICLALMAALALGAAAKPTAVPNRNDMVTVYFDDGYAWEGCRVHWLGSETLCSWPGELMTWERTGYWSASVPADAENLIFSYDGNYSPVLTMPRDEKVLYILGENRWTTNTPTIADGSFYIVGNSPEFSTRWNELTAANRLQQCGDQWTITYQDVPIGYWEFAITDGVSLWGDEQEADSIYRFLAEGPGDMTVTFNSQTGKVVWDYAYDPPMGVPKMAIYCRAPESWENCYAFWCGSVNTCTEQPGEAMEYMGDSLWKLDVYSDIQEVWFSNGNGSGAYAQIPFTDRMLYDYRTGHWENPVEISELSTVRVVGNADFMGNWDVAAEDGRMTRLDEYSYEVCFEDVPPGHYEFRIAADANWNRRWMKDGRNYTVDVSETCDLEIIFAPAEWGDRVVTIRRNGIEEPENQRREYRVAGNAKFMGDWNPANDAGLMTQNSDGLYEKVFDNVEPGCYEFKITYGGVWDYSWGADDGSNYMLDLQALSNVTITFDPTAETIHVTVEPVDGEQQEYRVVGDAAFMGNWNPADDAGLMTENEGGLYERWFYSVEPGFYRFKITLNGTWDCCWGDDGDDYVLELDAFGDLLVIFDPIHGTIRTAVVPIAEDQREYRVVGNAKFMGNWDPCDDAGLMVENDVYGRYEKRFTNVHPGCYEFKIIRGKTWDHVWDDKGENYILDIPSFSDVVITFDPERSEVTVDIEDLTGPIYRVTGNSDIFGNWDLASDAGKMKKVAPGIYKKTFYHVPPGEYELGVTVDGCWNEEIDTETFQIHTEATIVVTFDSTANILTIRGYGPAYCGEDGPDMITIMDVVMLYAQVCGGNVPENSLTHYDLNGDGNVNIADVAQMYNRVKMGGSYFA